MGALAHGDHGTQQHQPDEHEPGQLLGPDVGGNQIGVARDHLHGDRHDQDGDSADQQPGEELVVARDQFIHGVYTKTPPGRTGKALFHRMDYLIATILAWMASAPISLAYAAITGSTMACI